jgi:hypothetical protein
MSFRAGALAGLVVAACAMPVLAHHADIVTYDPLQTMIVKGTVKEFKWANPHSLLVLLVTEGKGNPVQWTIQFPSATWMAWQGVSPKNYAHGTSVTLRIHPRRDGNPGGVLEERIYDR